METFACFVLAVLAVLPVNDAEPCATPNSTEGRCVPIEQCPPLKMTFESSSINSLKHLKQSQCGFYNSTPMVCCETSKNYKKYTSASNKKIQLESRFGESEDVPVWGSRFGVTEAKKEKCGHQTYEDRITDGTITSIDEFPWMALLKYRTRLGPAIGCGGALINSKFVLTAAHCVTGASVQAIGVLENVTLGEYDVSTVADCDLEWSSDECIEQSVDHQIEKVYSHPAYKPDANRYNDIALILLLRTVEFTDFIKPICLPPNNIHEHLAKPKLFLHISGWGSTRTAVASKVKLKAQVPIIPFVKCSYQFQQKGIQLSQTQICAGGQRKDSCRGDSGGPLMYLSIPSNGFPTWQVVGVVSFGYKDCGTDGIPSVYTNVSSYLPWIYSIISNK